MSLDLLYSTHSQVAKLGVMVNLEFNFGIGQGIPDSIRECDLLYQFFHAGGWFCPYGADTVSHAFGFRGSDTLNKIVVSNKPESATYRQLENFDREYYSSFLENIRQFGNFLFGKSGSMPDFSGEKFCRHYTYTGEASTGSVDLQSVHPGVNFFGMNIPCRWFHERLWFRCFVTQLNPLTIALVEDVAYVYNFNILDLLDALIKASSHSVDTSRVSSQTNTISGVRYKLTRDYLTIDYKMSVRTHPVAGNNFYSDNLEWESRIVIPFGVASADIDPTVGGLYVARSTVFPSTLEYSSAVRQDAHPDVDGPSSGSYSSGSARNTICFLTNPSTINPEDEFRYDFVTDGIYSNSPLATFARAADREYHQILPSSLFSSVDAFKASENSLDMNILQNLQKLPDIASAIPKIKEAVSVASRLLRRDLSFSTFREILDLITSTVLQKNFQWDPYYRVLTEYLPRMASIYSSLGRTGPRVIGRGSYLYKLPFGSLGRKDVTLRTRTKLVMDTSSSGLLSAILGADAIGVLPKASNLWDLVPFSFVANWFTGVGGAMRRAEYAALMAAIPAYYVHTYQLDSPFTTSELGAWNLQSSDGRPASLRLYYRDVSLYSPTPRDSKFGFGIPTELPPLGTLGSLLYQLILR